MAPNASAERNEPDLSNEPEASEQPNDAVSTLESKVVTSAQDVAEEAKHLVTDATGVAKKSAVSRITGGKTRVADGLGSVAEALRHTGEHLSGQDDLHITDYVASAAGRVEAASGYLRDTDLSDVLGDVGDFARREPALFLGGAFALGLLGGRFMKASRARAGEAPSKPKTADEPTFRGRADQGRQTSGQRNLPAPTSSGGGVNASRATEPLPEFLNGDFRARSSFTEHGDDSDMSTAGGK